MRTTERAVRGYPIAVNELKEPISGFGLRTQWGSRAIGDAALTAGLETVDYADIRTMSILGGMWRKDAIVVYGRPAAVPAAPEVAGIEDIEKTEK